MTSPAPTAATPSLPAAVFFDFDGVLVDSERLHCETLFTTFHHFLRRTHRDAPPLELAEAWADYRRNLMGLDDRDAFRARAEKAGILLDEKMLETLIQEKAERFAAMAADGRIPAIDGSAAFARFCAEKVPVGLCSGALRSDILPLLKQLGLENTFRTLVTAEDTEKSKPDAAPYRLSLQKMAEALGNAELDAAQCVAIEDTPEGIRAATAAGIPVLGLCTQHPPEILQAAGATGVRATLKHLTPETLFALTHPAKERGERLQKVMAAAGIGSRRHCETLITAGRVQVDGRVVTELGTRVTAGQQVSVDGHTIAAEPHVYIMADKPRNILCTSADPRGRPTLLQWAQRNGAPRHLRLYTIGRLDGDSEGLILLTNDGDFAQSLSHPRHHVEKEYRVWIHRPLTTEDIQRLQRGIRDRGEVLRAKRVTQEPGSGKDSRSAYRARITLGEGKNRHIRRQLEALGIHVMRLRRIRIGPFTENDMHGEALHALSPAEVRRFFMVKR